MLPNSQAIETSLSPGQFFDRLRAETTPYDEIVQLRSPFAGYATFLLHSFVGSKRVAARIDRHSFMLVPLGIWPIKGNSPLANAGALHGVVEPGSAGARIVTHYRYAWGPSLFTVLLGIAALGLAAVALVVTLVFPELEGLMLLQGLAVASLAVTLVFAGYLWRGGRGQARALVAFLVEISDAQPTVREAIR